MEKRMKFDIKKLIESGLLRRIPSSKQKAGESIKASEDWIKESEQNLRNNSLKSCILTSYLAMFHCGRAILFLDGYREKSHFAVARYLEERYVKKKLLDEKWIKLLDHYREKRHQDQYNLSFVVTKKETEEALKIAKDFINEIKKLFEKIGGENG